MQPANVLKQLSRRVGGAVVPLEARLIDPWFKPYVLEPEHLDPATPVRRQ